MISKRGIGPIIATVLLLGFSIALATTVFLWMSGQTKTMSESTVEYVEGELQCQNIRIIVANKTDANPPCSKLDISNMGYLDIDFVVVREICKEGGAKSGGPLSVGQDFDGDGKLELPPKSSETETSGDYKTTQSGFCVGGSGHCSNCVSFEVMPIIQIQTRKVGCKDRTIVVEC